MSNIQQHSGQGYIMRFQKCADCSCRSTYIALCLDGVQRCKACQQRWEKTTSAQFLYVAHLMGELIRDVVHLMQTDVKRLLSMETVGLLIGLGLFILAALTAYAALFAVNIMLSTYVPLELSVLITFLMAVSVAVIMIRWIIGEVDMRKHAFKIILGLIILFLVWMIAFLNSMTHL